MLSLNQCVGANRPLIFVVAESDLEVLLHINKEFKKGTFYVYSTTLADYVELSALLENNFCSPTKAKTTVEVFNLILSKQFKATNHSFETYIFLDCSGYAYDPQVMRKIKDILSRYQLDPNYTVNLIMISQSVSVPSDLERLSEVVFFDLPNDSELKTLSDDLVLRLGLPDEFKPSDEVVNNLKGLTRFEVEQGYLQSFYLYKKIDLSFIRDFKKSAIAKTDLLSLLESTVTFDDIGGMANLKKWIEKSYGGWTVEGKSYGLPLLKGLLLVGLSGCGKTLICKAIGNQWGLPVIQLDPSRLFSSRVGESESNMRRVLQIIENVSPCILMIDEIEKGFAGIHSSTFSDAGVTARVIGSFLIWLQDCTKPIFTVATSNAIHYLPPELISRFDETFFVNLPQFNERRDIFTIHLKKLNRDPLKFHVEQLAENSEDLSGREIEQVLREAMYDSYHEGKELSTDIILSVLKKKTNLLTTMAEQLDYLLKWVGWDESRQDGVRARFANPVENSDMSRVKDTIDKMISDIEGKDINRPKF